MWLALSLWYFLRHLCCMGTQTPSGNGVLSQEKGEDRFLGGSGPGFCLAPGRDGG